MPWPLDLQDFCGDLTGLAARRLAFWVVGAGWNFTALKDSGLFMRKMRRQVETYCKLNSGHDW